MARYDAHSEASSGIPRTADQLRVCEAVERIFGWRPEEVDFTRPPCGVRGACSVKVRMGRSGGIDFTVAEGVLVGFFPKKWEMG